MKKLTFSLFPLMAGLLCVGCQTEAVYFATSTQLGVELGSTTPTKQTARVGFERFEGVTMPTRRADGTLIPKAYPVLSIFDLKSGSLNVKSPGSTTIRQVFATGRAAVKDEAAEAVGNTMRELASVQIVGIRSDADQSNRVELQEILNKLPDGSVEEERRVLGIITEELGLSQDTDFDGIGDAIRTAPSAQITAALDKVK